MDTLNLSDEKVEILQGLMDTLKAINAGSNFRMKRAALDFEEEFAARLAKLKGPEVPVEKAVRRRKVGTVAAN